jgi:hypothetical protein
MTGLPFYIPNNNANVGAVPIFLENVSFANQFAALSDINAATFALLELTEAGALTAITNSNFEDNSVVSMSMTYFV